MSMRLAGCGAAVAVAAVLFASTAASQTTKAQPATKAQPTTQPAPKGADFRVEVDGLIVADFSARIAAYAELRRTLEEGLPGLVVTSDHSEIRRAEAALASRIRMARTGYRQGNIFTPAISVAFKQLLAAVTNPGICAALLEDNPGHIAYRTDRAYPRNEPLSTVPPGILGALPALPEDVQYRFIERHLILYDTRANLILDRIRNAVGCQ